MGPRKSQGMLDKPKNGKEPGDGKVDVFMNGHPPVKIGEFANARNPGKKKSSCELLQQQETLLNA